MSNLYMMCGIPGSGKTTFAKDFVGADSVYISRDKIRLSLLQLGEDYFSHEDEVKTIFWGEITKNLCDGKDVIVDQTSLTRKSREYLLNHVKGYDKVICIYIKIPLQQALQQNENRKGTIAYVPKGQIKRMFLQLEEPSTEEKIDRVFIVENNTVKEESD